MEHLGLSQPTEISAALGLPPGLARLLAERGEGVLCGTLRLCVPGSEGHACITGQLAAARAATEGTEAWLTLSRTVRGPRSLLLGAGLGSFLMLDTAPHADGEPLWLLHRAGNCLEVGRDLPDVVRLIMGGALHTSWTSVPRPIEASDAPAMLGILLQYDTRVGSTEAFLAALRSGDDDACDRSFEHFASARTIGACVVEARRVLMEAHPSDAALREWTKTLDRMAKRNPVAVEVAEYEWKTSEEPPLFPHMEACGFLPGGELDERVAYALEGTGDVYWIPPSYLDRALTCEGLSAESRERLLQALKSVRAIDAYVLLACAGLVDRADLEKEHPLTNRKTTIALEDVPAASTWPVALLAIGTNVFIGRTAKFLRVLEEVDDPLIPRVLEERLLACPKNFGFGDEGAVAALVVRRNPPTEARVAAWIAAVRAVGETPKRYRECQSETIFALLERSFALDTVMEFYIREHNRAPHSAVEAARRRGNTRLSRDLLFAIFQGTGPLPERHGAATLAWEWGDARAKDVAARLDKTLEAEMRRIERM